MNYSYSFIRTNKIQSLTIIIISKPRRTFNLFFIKYMYVKIELSYLL